MRLLPATNLLLWAILLLVATHTLACELAQCRSTSNCPNPQTESQSEFKAVCMNEGTERAHTGLYDRTNPGKGVYRCSCCGNILFASSEKYNSGSGWPSYWAVWNATSVTLKKDNSCWYCGERVAVDCHRCGAHLGHVFDDGPKPTGHRYCMNSVCLHFDKNVDLKQGNRTWFDPYESRSSSSPSPTMPVLTLLVLASALLLLLFRS